MSEKKEFTLGEWARSMPEIFDAREAVKETILPLMHQLQQACIDAGVPSLIAVGTCQDEASGGIEVMQAFPGAERTPTPFLVSLMAFKGDYDSINDVFAAWQDRGERVGAMQVPAPESVTKH